jgi:hypothetical protein
MSAREKVGEIFRELVPDRADRLAGDRYLADVNSRITAAIARTDTESDILSAGHLGFHLVDWQSEAAFLVALSLYPERFTDEEVREGVDAFLLHAPAHVQAAARLAGVPIPDLLAEDKAQPVDPDQRP